MESRTAFATLRVVYDEINLRELTDEEVENYRNIGSSMVLEADRELLRRKNKENKCKSTCINKK